MTYETFVAEFCCTNVLHVVARPAKCFTTKNPCVSSALDNTQSLFGMMDDFKNKTQIDIHICYQWRHEGFWRPRAYIILASSHPLLSPPLRSSPS